MSTLKEIKRIQKLAAGEATMEDIDAQNAKPIQHTTNAQRNAAQPSKLQQLIDAVSSKRGISTGVGAGVGGATGYSVGAATGMSPKAKMLATILGAAAGGTAGNLFAKQSAQDGPRSPKGVADAEAAEREAAAAKEKAVTSQFGYEGRSNPLKGALDVKPQSKLQQLLAAIQNVDKTRAAYAGGGAALGAGAGVGGAALMGGSSKAKILAGILGGLGGGAAGYKYGPEAAGKLQGLLKGSSPDQDAFAKQFGWEARSNPLKGILGNK
ncbi:MAG: hypothetical protein WC907_05985 [Acholeplasmataceae bacterium]